MGSDPTARADSPGAGRTRFGGIVLDAAAHTLTRDGQPQALEPKAFAVLLELVGHAGELVGRDQLLDAVWGHRHVTPGVLTRAIAQVRTALDDDPHQPRYIQTQHALGYRFIGEIEPETPTAPAETSQDPSSPAPEPPAARSVATTDGPRHERRRTDRIAHRRWLLLAVLLAALLAWTLLPRPFQAPLPGEASIAVLPFTTLSDDRQDRYFAEGLAAEMLSALAGVDGLKVAAWRPAEAIDRRLDLPALGRHLGVATVLDASVRREGERVRIIARLSDTATGYTLWSETYDRNVTALFDTQSQIATEVAATLVGVLPDAGEGLRRRLTPTRNLAAFDAYLRGLQGLMQPVQADDAALGHFREALEEDAGFARAQAGICRIEIWRFEAHHNATAYESARLACLRAANMDPGIGIVQLALGDLYRANGPPAKALEHYRLAEADHAVRADAIAGQASVFAAEGDMDKAIESFRRALAINPDDAAIHAALGYQQHLAGKTRDAIDSYHRATVLDPSDAYLWSTYGALLMTAGDNHEAMKAFERSMAIEPIEAVLGNLGTLKYQAGDYAGAAALYRRAIDLNPGNPAFWGNLGDALQADPATGAQSRPAYVEAAQRAQAFVDVKQDDARALAMLGWFRANLGESEVAVALANRAETLGQQAAEVALFNAQTFALLGDLEQARRRLAAARAAGAAEVRISSNAIFRRAGLVPADATAVSPAPPEPARRAGGK